MPLSTSIGATRKFATAAARVKPEYESYRHIVSPYKCAVMTMLGGEITTQNEMGKDTTTKKSAALIRSRKINQLKARNQDFGVIPYQLTSAAAKSGIAAGTPFTHAFASAAGRKVGDLLKNLSTGVVYWVSVVSGNTLTLNIQAGGTDDIGATDRFLYVGNARPDFWTFGTGVSMEPEEYYNLLQTHCSEVGIGMLAERQETFPKGNGNAEDRLVVLESHAMGRNLAAIDGVMGSTSQGGETVQSCDGFRTLAETRVDAGGSMSYESFRRDFETRVSKPGKNRMLCGSLVKANIDLWNHSKADTSMSDKMYGVDIDVLQGLFQHRLHIDEVMENYAGSIVNFQAEKLERVFLDDLDGLFMKEVQASDTAGKVDAYITTEAFLRTDEEGLQILENFMA
jgi:hypothetical protein